MTVQPNPPTPITIEVNIKPNSEVITPLELGSIKYQYPKVNGDYLVTDQISEIVVLDSPIGYTRFSAIYGAEASLNVTRSAQATRYLGGTAVSAGSLNYSTSLPLSSLNSSDPDTITFSPGSGIFNGPQLPGGTSITGDVDTPRWSLRNSSAYYPQLDFFPRYNQWFASTVWSTPFDPQNLLAPAYYDIMLVYVDRASKQVYYRNGRVNFIRQLAFNPVFVPQVTLDSVEHEVTELEGARNLENSYQFNLRLRGSSTAGLVETPGFAEHQLIFTGTTQLGYFETTLATFPPGVSPFDSVIPVASPPGLFFYDYLTGPNYYSPYRKYPRQRIDGLYLKASWTNSEGDNSSVQSPKVASAGTVNWFGDAPPSNEWPLF